MISVDLLTWHTIVVSLWQLVPTSKLLIQQAMAKIMKANPAAQFVLHEQICKGFTLQNLISVMGVISATHILNFTGYMLDLFVLSY